MTIDDIMEIVAKHFDMTPSDLLRHPVPNSKADREMSNARGVAMWFMRDNDHRDCVISRYFGIYPQTSGRIIERIDGLIDTDEKMRDHIGELKDLIYEEAA